MPSWPDNEREINWSIIRISKVELCSAECVAQRSEGVIVQGDIAVVAEVVVEPDARISFQPQHKTSRKTAYSCI